MRSGRLVQRGVAAFFGKVRGRFALEIERVLLLAVARLLPWTSE
jgi:hypothetical protein